jgi:hypothetical protein
MQYAIHYAILFFSYLLEFTYRIDAQEPSETFSQTLNRPCASLSNFIKEPS